MKLGCTADGTEPIALPHSDALDFLTLTPERHAKIQELFDAALDLPSDEQQSFLAVACDGDAELLSHLNRLLAAFGDDDKTVSSPVAKELSEPSLIDGKYQVEKSLGRGGMGAVFLVRHSGLDKQFALKLILASGTIPSGFLRRFETEARALGRLKHPNIVEVTDYGVDQSEGGIPYLVMEYLEGRTAQDLLKLRKTVPLDEALPILRDTAAAIDYAHSQGIVHGDLKPANLFLAQRGNQFTAKVVDFGLASLSTSSQPTIAGEGIAGQAETVVSVNLQGTPGYMAAELFRLEPASPASDIFAFGVMTYELLTGDVPFGRQFNGMSEKLHTQPAALSQRLASLPPEIDSVILSMLSPEAGKRPASATTAIDALEAAFLSAQQREWRVRETPRRTMIALAAAALILFVALVLARTDMVNTMEGRIADSRFSLLPSSPPDPHLLLVSLDRDALAEDRRPLAQWGPEFGEKTDRILSGGARAVAIDLLLPAAWAEVPSFRRMVQRNADHLVLGVLSAGGGEIVGTESVGELTAHLLGPERYLQLFGFVNLEEDADRTVRRARGAYLDRTGTTRPSFAGRAVTAASLAPASSASFWIDYSVRPAEIPSVSWKDVDSALSKGAFRDRLVIIGADFAGSGDELRVPPVTGAESLAGVKLQALIVNTLITGTPLTDAPRAAYEIPIAIACFGIVFTALRFPHRLSRVMSAAAAFGGLYIACTYFIFLFSRAVIPSATPVLAILTSALSSFWLKSRLSPYPTLIARKEIS